MSRLPEDAPSNQQQAPMSQQQPGAGSKVKGAFAKFGNAVKTGAQKAADSAKKFASETKEDFQNSKTMEGLLTMASNEFEQYIRQRANTTDKVKRLQKIADSFKNAEGICFVTTFNVAFTVGGAYGRGIVMKRLGPGNWSLPLAIQEIEANVGWQINFSRSKAFYVLRNDQAIRNFQQKGNAKLGGKGFAAVGNLGGQVQGNVKSSKESLTKSTKDAAEVAAANASVGSVKGLALGVNVNLGTFQPSKKINNSIYENFDITKLFDKGVNDVQLNSSTPEGVEQKSAAADENNVNKVKNDAFLAQLQEFVQMIETVIEVDKTVAREAAMKKQAKAAAAAQGSGQNGHNGHNGQAR